MLSFDEADHCVVVKVGCEIVMDLFGDEWQRFVVGGVVAYDRGHVVDLFEHRREEKIDKTADDEGDFRERQEYRDDPPAEMKSPEIEFDQRLKDIGDQAGQTEGEQHIAQYVDEPESSRNDGDADQDADDSVEGEWS